MTSPNCYAGWPTATDVRSRLAAAGIALRGDVNGVGAAGDARIQGAIDEVAAEVGRRTGRQFIADAPGTATARDYDGSGTGQLEIDEFVELVGVGVIGFGGEASTTLADVWTVVDQGKPTCALARGRECLSGVFPAGRQNVRVTARFGFAESIPADLWSHACGEMARRVAAEAIYQAGGLLMTSQTAGDEQQAFTLTDLEALGWRAAYERDVGRVYRRAAGRGARGVRAGMV